MCSATLISVINNGLVTSDPLVKCSESTSIQRTFIWDGRRNPLGCKACLKKKKKNYNFNCLFLNTTKF